MNKNEHTVLFKLNTGLQNIFYSVLQNILDSVSNTVLLYHTECIQNILDSVSMYVCMYVCMHVTLYERILFKDYKEYSSENFHYYQTNIHQQSYIFLKKIHELVLVELIDFHDKFELETSVKWLDFISTSEICIAPMLLSISMSREMNHWTS